MSEGQDEATEEPTSWPGAQTCTAQKAIEERDCVLPVGPNGVVQYCSMTSTLAETMVDESVSFAELERNYKPVLGLVKELLGVVPNCDKYLEIWPPAFRTYNLLVPSFLNLPLLLFGRAAPKDIVGLAMYTSSRAADCAYCSAHTCSFALRRGASADAVSGAKRTDAEQAVVDMAESLSTMPHSYVASQRSQVNRHFDASDTEWIGLGVAMMGFLNKFMDAMGIDLEPESIADVADLIGPTGWSTGQHGWDLSDTGQPGGSNAPPALDSMATYARVARLAPGAVRLEKQWMKNIPSSQVEARNLIRDTYGFDEPSITGLMHKKPALALAAMLAENLNAEHSTIGMANKAAITKMFAELTGSAQMHTQADAMASQYGRPSSDDATASAVSQLVVSVADSPASLEADRIIDLRNVLDAAQVVETVTWVSILQLLYRLDTFLS